MPSNTYFVCFACQAAVRRPEHVWDPVACPDCGDSMNRLSDRVPLPPKKDERAWRELEAEYHRRERESTERARVERVRRLHELEREVARLEQLPENKGRARLIGEMRDEIERM